MASNEGTFSVLLIMLDLTLLGSPRFPYSLRYMRLVPINFVTCLLMQTLQPNLREFLYSGKGQDCRCGNRPDF
jgi:hypothetical protein